VWLYQLWSHAYLSKRPEPKEVADWYDHWSRASSADWLQSWRVRMDRSGQPRGLCPRPASRLVLCRRATASCRSGWVQSALRILDDAPNQREGAPSAWIRFDEQVAEGAKDLRPGDEIVVLTWLHLSPRDELSTHPEDDMSQPLTRRVQHLFAQSAEPHRPAHRARIVARDGLRIEVDALEAIDGTPVADVKPAIDPPV
jgi:tRNA (Thr-GGU) A37 N-methylase